VKVIDNTFIPMSDGCRLAARIWLPDHADSRPVAAVLEYLPYRKRDFTALRDAGMHAYFAEHGIAGVRVDLRGSGDSDGILRDEYLQKELDDGLEVLRWIAAQQWCTGSIGMFGLSWGGFNALQIAALAPPELKAVIAVCATDDRYRDDIHYMGGALLTDNLSWASTMFAYNSCPPDPVLAGPNWQAKWLERLEGSGLWLKTWLEHQRKDDYWRHASVGEDYDAIRCPVYVISGWADGYSNTVFRLVENLKVATKGLIGAWGHKFPHMGKPGPGIGFLQEAVRWWRHWLDGQETGIMDEPALQVWMQDSVSPRSQERPGSWIAEEGWPSSRLKTTRLFATSSGRLVTEQPPAALVSEERTIQSPLSVGLFAGKWYSYSAHTDLPSDQREEDGGALVFETGALEADLQILGAPVCSLGLKTDKPVAMVACRISDIAEDGSATRVTYGILNLTHRHLDGARSSGLPGAGTVDTSTPGAGTSGVGTPGAGGPNHTVPNHTAPQELPADQWVTVDVPLNYIAQRFAAGHRIRLSISTSYWPLVWPAPESARLTLDPGQCALDMPVRDRNDGPEPRRFEPPEQAGQPEHHILEPARREWRVTHNLANDEARLTVINNDARYRFESDGWTIHRKVTEEYSYRRNRYDTLRAEVRALRSFQQGEWEAYTETRTLLTSTQTHFRIQATLDAYEGDTRLFSKSWDERVPRDLL